jgi:exodeoxyribonuclease VII large subunit
MRSTIWNVQYQKINKSFLETLQVPLKEGMSVLLKGKLNYHQNYGFSIQISHIDPSFTLGEMASEKQKCILQLKKEGFFYLNKKLDFPELPKRLAIISYNTSKGYQDFLEIIDKFSHKFSIQYQLYPSLLQGDKAVENMLAELSQIETRLDKFDLVLIIRGGGGDVGMNCYDDYSLAKRIATFPLPVLTGIGHSTNETVAEMVAHKNCITPTDLAYEILTSFQEKESLLIELEQKLHRFGHALLVSEQQKISRFQQRLVQQTKMLLQVQHKSMEVVEKELSKQSFLLLKKSMSSVEKYEASAHEYPKKRFLVERELMKKSQLLLLNGIQKVQSSAKHQLEINGAKLELLSPEKMFKRGFSISLKGGKVITSSKELRQGDTLETVFLDGRVMSKIEKEKKATPKNRP